MIGKTISHYTILEKIGEGGMGVVYKAKDIKLKRTVAIKFLPSELTRVGEAKERFIQEAQAAVALDHQNICTVYEVDESEAQTFIAMAYIEGQTLKGKIAKSPLAAKEAVNIATQAAEGLREAHQKGIIHRDIKPANIMLTKKGQAKIMDFGLARLEWGVDLTKTATIMGTVAYMSPEQARGEKVDLCTDIWSLGCVIFEMLSGQSPFKGDYDQAVLYSILHEEAQSITSIRKDIPPRIELIIGRCLQKAMEIDDSLSEVYCSLALITYCYEWDLPAAERHARRSIELNPQNMWAHAAFGEILGTLGRMEEALEEAKKTMDLDPLSSMSHAFYGVILGAWGRAEESREQLLRAVAMEPDQPMFYLWLGMVYLVRPAIPEKAIEYLQKAADAGVTLAYGYLGMGQALAGRKEEALKCLEKLERVEKERFLPLPLKLLLYLKPGLRHFRSFKKKYCPAHMKAVIYLGLNMQEEALDQLEKSCQARDYLMPVFFRVMVRLYDVPWDITISPKFQALRAKNKTA